MNTTKMRTNNIPGLSIAGFENIGVMKHIIAQVARPGHVVEDFGEVGHVVVDGLNRSRRVDPVVVVTTLAESAHLLVLLVVLQNFSVKIKAELRRAFYACVFKVITLV